MKILVLFDSFFGNTAKIAQAIAEELSQHHEITSERVDTANLNQLQHLDLFFIGSPTRAFSASPNITAFLKTIPVQSLAGVKVAVFDTRIEPEDIKPKLVGLAIKWAGYADRKIISLLKPSGADVILPGEGFLVSESEGPLKDGELARAATWARSLVTNFAAKKD